MAENKTDFYDISKVFTDPAKIIKLSKKGLVRLYEITNHLLDDLEAQRKVVKDELMAKMDTHGEVVGNYSLVKAKRVNFKVELEKAKELGCTKIAVDNSALKKLWNKGVKIPHDITEYLLIKEIKKEKEIKK